MRYVKSFAYFLWDFVVGDAPELAAGNTLLLIAILALGLPEQGGALILPFAIAAMLTASVYWGKLQIERER